MVRLLELLCQRRGVHQRLSAFNPDFIFDGHDHSTFARILAFPARYSCRDGSDSHRTHRLHLLPAGRVVMLEPSLRLDASHGLLSHDDPQIERCSSNATFR
jgi:hypothetical protein